MYRFTEKAEKVMSYAQDSAVELGHNYIGTEHLLIGLCREANGIAGRVLADQGIDDKKVIEKIEELIGTSSGTTVGTLGFTPRTKRVLELALMEARNMGQNYIGTEHILFGIMREGDSIAVRVLAELGIDLQKLYNDLVRATTEGGFSTSSTKSKKSSKDTSTPTLNQFGRDLTQMAKEGKLDPVVGRDEEIERVIQILSRRTKNNPCLIGEPGVGKTAIAEGLAEKIYEGNTPELLKGKRVVTMDLSSMVAGAKYRGEFEERLKKALEEIKKSGNIILFIDELHTIVGAGAAEGAIDAANILKPLLARGEIQVIGATTLNEYKKYIEKDAALERRFQPIIVGEPSIEDAIQILKGLRDKYEAHHKIKITDEAIVAAVKLSDRYINDRFLPDKAIDLMDEAASRLRLKMFTAPGDVKEMEDKISKIAKEKEEAIKAQEFERAAKLRDEEQEIRAQLEEIKNKWQKENEMSDGKIGEEEIAEIVASATGIPVKRLAEEETERLRNMESYLHNRVVGQEEAVSAISKAIRRGRVGIKDPKRPTGSFLFLGPTGVGKTELSKALAEALFGDENSMIRVDMSEYMEKHTVSKLVGSPPGYVGYDEGGQLTDKVRRKPYSVILFDEIEKAHPDVFNILLQILEDGRLTDSQGRTVDFKNTVIIMTSNAGARTISDSKKLGFQVGEDKAADYNEIKSNVMAEVKRMFRPEFLNRIDEIIVFHQLTKEDVKQIADIMIKNLIKRLDQEGYIIEISDETKDMLAEKGFDANYGARPLRRVIQTEIEDKIAEGILDGTIKIGEKKVL